MQKKCIFITNFQIVLALDSMFAILKDRKSKHTSIKPISR